MRIRDVYIGGWFQRTTLHLSEFYDFVRGEASPLDFDPDTLDRLRQALGVESVEMCLGNLEYLDIWTTLGIHLQVYEDGLIALGKHYGDDDEVHLADDIAALRAFYENELSEAFSYLYSLGAPVPKELANIETVFPYFIVAEDTNEEEVASLIREHDNQDTYYEAHEGPFDIYRGDKLYVLHNKEEDRANLERFVHEQVFLREFTAQLHRYLNLHRTIWEKIEAVKEQGEIKGREVAKVKQKVDQYKKTINYIDARINQMGTYIHTREAIVKSDPAYTNFRDLLEYKYENMENTLAYVKEIWAMTQKYVDSALRIFGDLQSKATQNSVKNLTVVTSMGVGGTLLGLFTRDQLPDVSLVGAFYFVALAAIGYGANKAINWYYAQKDYVIHYTEFDRDI